MSTRLTLRATPTRRPDIGPMLVAAAALILPALALGQGFQVEDSTIDGMQKAIQEGRITCQGVVQAYLDRVKAYNGSCTALVTADGKAVPAVKGRILGGKAVTYPTQTVAASTFLPDFASYQGPPLELGRMEPTVSDPSVHSNGACA